jgi:benzoyl-CoA 2,3-dioxygenase component A
MDCIRPCPTGAIDQWLPDTQPFSVTEQLTWHSLPKSNQEASRSPAAVDSALDSEPSLLPDLAHEALGSNGCPPISATKPATNLWTRESPARAIVTGNLRVTDHAAVSDVRHIILDLESQSFPFLEGQTIGVAPPGCDEDGRPHAIRLYSVASARDGEKPNTNNFAIIVKRVVEPRVEGKPFLGLASNWLCDLAIGAELPVIGPFGETFLAPEDSNANVLMICTGTGAAPFRGFVHRRRRTQTNAKGRYLLFFGARSPGELPHFGPLQTVPPNILEKELVYSRMPGQRKEYVQDRMRRREGDIAILLGDPATHIYVCGLRGLEDGVERAFTEIGRKFKLDWLTLRETMRSQGRYHIETY